MFINPLKCILSAVLLFCLSVMTNAQVITLGNGYFANSTLAGPANTSSAAGAGSRYAYIFPASLLGSLRHGDSIRSISFMRNGGDSISGSCNMRIFIRTTVNTTYGNGSINWVNRTGSTGMRLVYDKNPAADIGNTPGWVRFAFTSPFVVDTVFGKNLELLVEYTQVSSQANSIYWNFETANSISAYAVNQTKFVSVNGLTLTDTTRASSDIHPVIRIEFPREDYDLAVNKIYSLGKIPVPLGNPDSVKAIIQNAGRKSGTFKLYLYSRGANNLVDSGNFSLGYLEEKMIVLPLLYPNNTGLDTLFVRMENDSNPSNNTLSAVRLATSNIYSYKDPTRPIAGGIGFNGSTGDFVARFYSSSAKAINQISVNFAGSTQRFKLGIWKDDGPGGKPGTNIWTSDTLITAPSFITPVLPPVSVAGNFYVGVRQIGTVNVAFGYQPEQPVRPNTFYYTSPTGDTNWVDFSPGAPFKFAIEPRLQAANDVSAVSVLAPRDTIVLYNAVAMAPRARVVNYGSNAQLTPFTVKINIFRYGNLVYTSTRQDTLSSGHSRTIVFDSSFLPQLAGEYDIQAMTLLGTDQMRDNDTTKSRFVVAAFKDVGPGTVFDPFFNAEYEQFVDTIYPTVFIQNYGLDQQGPFTVRAFIYDSAQNIVYQDFRQVTLSPLSSILASFDPFPCSVKGRYSFVSYTALTTDVKTSNDTARRTFSIIRSNDVAISGINYPQNGSSLLPPVSARKPEATLINVGDAHQTDPFQNYCDIYFGGNLIYRDSISVNAFKGSTSTLLFKNFQPSAKGYYRMLVYASLPTDQFRANDTLVSNFALGVPDDVELLSFTPAPGGLQLGQTYASGFTVRNNGYIPQNTPFPIVFRVSKGTDLVYAKVKMITLDSGETQTFALDSTLVLDEPGVYSVGVFSALSNDFIRKNDTLEGEYTGLISQDIGVSAILYPTIQDTLLVNTGSVESLVRVKNFGDSASIGVFRVHLKVFNKASGNQIYSKFIDTALNGLDSIDLRFPSFGISNPVSVRLQAFTEWAPDQYTALDTSYSEGRFMVLYDARAAGLFRPAAGSIVRTDASGFLPEILIENISVKALNGLTCNLLINQVDTLTLTETEVYSDAVILSSLLPSSGANASLVKVLEPSVLGPGYYKAYMNVVVPEDQIPFNNVATASFWIQNPLGVNTLYTGGLKLYPNPAAGRLYLEFSSETGSQTGQIMDAKGAQVLHFQTSGQINELDISSLSNGLYTLQCGHLCIKFVVDKP